METLSPTGSGRNSTVYGLQTDLWDVLLRWAATDPEVTVEEQTAALLAVTHRLVDQLRRGQHTPAASLADDRFHAAAQQAVAAMVLPSPDLLATLTLTFKQVLAQTSRCPVCKRLPTDPCRCRVEEPPDPYPPAIAALFPIVAAFVTCTADARPDKARRG